MVVSNPFDNLSTETLAVWDAQLSANHSNELRMDDLWVCTASEEIECKNCDHFEDTCTANHSDMCPKVIAVFNLDNKHFN